MPWCDDCDRFLSPSTVRADGTCPTCGRTVEPGHAHVAAPSTPVPDEQPAKQPGDADDDEELPPIPWHLWLLAAALAVYLGYRAFQGLQWVFGF